MCNELSNGTPSVPIVFSLSFIFTLDALLIDMSREKEKNTCMFLSEEREREGDQAVVKCWWSRHFVRMEKLHKKIQGNSMKKEKNIRLGRRWKKHSSNHLLCFYVITRLILLSFGICIACIKTSVFCFASLTWWWRWWYAFSYYCQRVTDAFSSVALLILNLLQWNNMILLL